MKTALVCGAGGFIGGHLVKRLKSEGYWVRGVDLKYPEFGISEADEFIIADLRDRGKTRSVIHLYYTASGEQLAYEYYAPPYSVSASFHEVYQLAADMGGAGYVFTGENDADIMHNSALINLNVLEACDDIKPDKIFYSSSACIYPEEAQNKYDATSLSEYDAYPANPDSEYGWEKLFSERLYKSYAKNKGIDVRIARFHNIFGPQGTYKGGKEKAPAALCRKVLETEDNIEVWGTGLQTRSFLYIDECIEGIRRLMQSDYTDPINIGSNRSISINDLAQMIIDISGKGTEIKNIEGPEGVMGRNSDNELINDVLDWEPSNDLEKGIRKTYDWIESEINK